LYGGVKDSQPTVKITLPLHFLQNRFILTKSIILCRLQSVFTDHRL
jgi:hypothetical protein